MLEDQPERHLRRAISLVQELVAGSIDLRTTLGEITSFATAALGADMAGLTIGHVRGRQGIVAFTDPMVAEIDKSQYEHDRGPGLDAARTRETVEVQDLRNETRWPEFVTSALNHGIRSALSVPVVAADDSLGALNFYDRRTAYFDVLKRDLAASFASQCAVAGGYWKHATEASGLAKAMETRAIIEQAKGIIMASSHCDAEAAFDLLRQQSQHQNRKLRDIAAELVNDQASRPWPTSIEEEPR